MAGRERIGFVGIGNMGAPMVRCLARAGFTITLFDQRPEATAPFASEAGVFSIASDLRELGAAANVVITMLPDGKAVSAAVLGTSECPGISAQLRPGSVLIDMSSSYALATVALGARLAAQDIGVVDAPVSGGVPRRSMARWPSWQVGRPL